jgi:hypothetical protein
MARRKAQTYGVVPCGTRAPRGVQSRRFANTGPRFPYAGLPQPISQLLAGTPNGPGGSPDAARVPMLRA